MAISYICTTIFFHSSREELVSLYEANAEPSDGYLTHLHDIYMLVDAMATETADWDRQITLASQMTEERGIALSIMLIGETWALALAFEGKVGPVAVYIPDEPKALERLPTQLLNFERALDDFFPDDINIEQVDYLLGALLEGALPAEEVINSLLEMLGCPADWERWAWYETIPQQLFIDPDLADRVTPLGEAKNFWEE